MITAAMRANIKVLWTISKKFLSIVSFDTKIDQYASCKNGIRNPNNKGNIQIKCGEDAIIIKKISPEIELKVGDYLWKL